MPGRNLSICRERMDAMLEGLLKAIDLGDADAIGIPADWLEERGDPRCTTVRAATLPDCTAMRRPRRNKTDGLLQLFQESPSAP